MQGFGVQTKNINDLIAKIEKEIDYVTKNMDRNVIVLNNKLTYCSSELERLKTELAKLKEYALEEYNKLETKVSSLESQINFLKAHINVITTKSLDGNTYAVGIAPSSVYEQTGKTYPIWANRAEKDDNGNSITATYATKTEINTINEKITELSGKSVKYLGEMSLTAFSGLNPNKNDEYRIINAGGWKQPLPNPSPYLPIRVSDGDNVLWNGKRWIHYIDNDQSTSISEDFINNLDWGI